MIGGGRQIARFVTAEKVPSLAWQTAIFHREAIAEVDEVAQITFSICVQTFSSAQFSTRGTSPLAPHTAPRFLSWKFQGT